MFCPECGSELPDGAGFCGECGTRLSSDMLGPYELRGELGRGAMAVVWRAWDTRLEREVAIKEPLFDPGYSDAVREEMTRRFVNEAKTAARLHHPGIVPIFSADVFDGRPAIVMELVEGATLSDLLSAGPLDPAAAIDAVDQLLDAVSYAHQNGIVHRDIKPDNVFVDKSGRIRLADFGIAHAGDTGGTVAGAVLGTPGYMSPEQAKGQPVDARSDLFSVGVVAYEALTGRHPFGAGDGSDSTTLLYRIVHEEPPAIPDANLAGLPADARPAIAAALAKDPNYRPQTADAMKAMLHGGQAPQAVPVPPQGSPLQQAAQNAPSQVKSKPWLPYALVGAAAALVLVVVLVFAIGGAGGGGGAAGTGGAGGSAYYISSDGTNVVIYSNSDNPVETTSLLVADLDSATAAQVAGRIPFASVAEAQNKVKELEVQVAQAKEAKAKEEASKKGSATLTVVGADGSTRTETIRRQGNSERVFPDSNSRLLTSSEVAALSDAERCIAWNEIIAASNGYAFKNSGLASYFNNCSWYTRNPGASGGGSFGSSSAAAQNVALLQSMTDGWWMDLAAY